MAGGRLGTVTQGEEGSDSDGEIKYCRGVAERGIGAAEFSSWGQGASARRLFRDDLFH